MFTRITKIKPPEIPKVLEADAFLHTSANVNINN